MQGECQRTIGAISAFSMAWKLPGVIILLQAGKLVRIGTPLRLRTNQLVQFTAYFHRSFLGIPRLAAKLTWHELRALGIAKRALCVSTSCSNGSVTDQHFAHSQVSSRGASGFCFPGLHPVAFQVAVQAGAPDAQKLRGP